jgi:phosphotransferase family enzyme
MDEETSSVHASPLDDVIPLANRSAVERALQAAFGSAAVDAIEPLTGGASGARVFRLTVRGAERLLRLETNRGGAHDPVRQFTCMLIASDAGVAPRVHYANADDGVAITDFIRANTADGDGGRRARLSSLARTVALLHEAPLFPPFMSFFDAMDFLIGSLETSGVIPASSCRELAAGYRAIAALYPRSDAELVSSHNDLNPSNVLFEGNRAWLIDWELAFAADRFVDLAALLNFFAIEPGDDEVLLLAYFADGLTPVHRARAFLMQQVNRIYYAAMLLQMAVMAKPDFRLSDADLNTRSFRDVRPNLAPVSSEEGRIRFACVFLHDALEQMESTRFRDALAELERLR